MDHVSDRAHLEHVLGVRNLDQYLTVGCQILFQSLQKLMRIRHMLEHMPATNQIRRDHLSPQRVLCANQPKRPPLQILDRWSTARIDTDAIGAGRAAQSPQERPISTTHLQNRLAFQHLLPLQTRDEPIPVLAEGRGAFERIPVLSAIIDRRRLEQAIPYQSASRTSDKIDIDKRRLFGLLRVFEKRIAQGRNPIEPEQSRSPGRATAQTRH